MNSQEAAGIDPVETPLSAINILENRIAELEQLLGAAKDEQIRLIAEMDNQRKRLARDVDAARKYGAERLLLELLSVVDSLEAGLSQGDADAGKLREGTELTLRVLMKTLEKNGVVSLNPMGEIFNPELHQAVSTASAPEQAANTVVAVLQKGFRLNERLVRPAMVTVARED